MKSSVACHSGVTALAKYSLTPGESRAAPIIVFARMKRSSSSLPNSSLVRRPGGSV
jgi:hypothetical protein